MIAGSIEDGFRFLPHVTWMSLLSALKTTFCTRVELVTINNPILSVICGYQLVFHLSVFAVGTKIKNTQMTNVAASRLVAAKAGQ